MKCYDCKKRCDIGYSYRWRTEKEKSVYVPVCYICIRDRINTFEREDGTNDISVFKDILRGE